MTRWYGGEKGGHIGFSCARAESPGARARPCAISSRSGPGSIIRAGIIVIEAAA